MSNPITTGPTGSLSQSGIFFYNTFLKRKMIQRNKSNPQGKRQSL